MRDFSHAVQKQIDPDDDGAITFMHGDQEVTFYEPSTGQQAIMLSMGRRDMDAKTAGTFITMMFSMMDDETELYFENRLMDNKDDFDLNSDGGLFDVFEALMEDWSARPTKEPSDYQEPQQSTGRSSTATSRAKGSTSSRSRSRASSR